MSPQAFDQLKRDLRRDEGERAKPYVDTVNKITIGVGRNLTDIGLSPDEIELLLDNDCARAFALASTFPWFPALDDVRQRVVLNLAFNLGSQLLQFHDTLGAIARGAYVVAADALQHSKWFSQVGRRGPRLVAMLRTGKDPNG
jgi:lysozyme